MLAVILASLVGCGASDYGLAPDRTGDGHAPMDDLLPTDDLGDGAAFAAWKSPATPLPVTTAGAQAPHATLSAARPATVRVEAFGVGPAPAPVADFLFVIDDSVSMKEVMGPFSAGIASLLQRGVFPSGSRLAVLNTTPGDPVELSMPHPVVPPKGDDDLAPGFLALVDGARIAAYRAVAPKRYARRYVLDGCDAWFAPGAQNAQGLPCLLAHTQIPLLPARAEAGLVALRQWLEASDAPHFRAGASVNVVYISDTHDPGLSPERIAELGPDGQGLVAARPDFATLRALVSEPVAAFRVHAIAPATHCSDERWAEPTYFDVVAEGGGVAADICVTRDYAPVIGAIAQAGSVRQEPVLRLGYPAARVEGVADEDGPVAWSPTDDPQAIVLDGGLPASVRQFRVRYRPGAGAAAGVR
ncbi:MAG: hypothetical protein Q8P18_09910 [Pseudomonadota bacterium]|nr:hypothetical protein [Pseudomonadota bacterium]